MAEKDEKREREKLRDLIEILNPPDDQMDVVSATIVLEQAGVDLSTLQEDLKTRLERSVEEMISRNEEVPADLLKVINRL